MDLISLCPVGLPVSCWWKGFPNLFLCSFLFAPAIPVEGKRKIVWGETIGVGGISVENPEVMSVFSRDHYKYGSPGSDVTPSSTAPFHAPPRDTCCAWQPKSPMISSIPPATNGFPGGPKEMLILTFLYQDEVWGTLKEPWSVSANSTHSKTTTSIIERSSLCSLQTFLIHSSTLW